MTTPVRPARASRVRKARKESACCLCPAAITIGQQIGRTPDGWSHVACILAQLDTLMRTPPRPSERG